MNTLDPPGNTRHGRTPGAGPPEKRSGPPSHGPLPVVAPTTTDTGIVAPDPFGIRWAARQRISQIDRERRISSELEQLAPLVVFYGPRRPRPIPLGQFLVEGWWAA